MINENIFHVIKDPVHGTMQFTTAEDNWVKPFIDSPIFQRLRHIKQLGMGDFIFPGAVHTRFNHCLGCCYIASQIAHKIGLAEEERQLVMIACLLHDIGHGPFSHAFEDIFYQKLIRHEAWTPFFLAEFRNAEFFAKYNRLNARHNLSEEKFQLIEDMIMHRSPKKLLADIVSSQMDADRLDYLLRDSHFCGVTYGQFDFRWLLHCMAIVQSNQGERLGVTHKGVGVVEHYLMARRLMMRNIYHYQKKLALESLLVKLLQTLSRDLAEYPAFSRIKSTRLGQFLLAANQFNQIAIQEKNIEPHRQQFLSDNYAIYKQLCDYDVFILIKELAELNDPHAAAQIAKRIHHRKLAQNIRLDPANVNVATELLAEFKNQHPHYQDWQIVLIQTPHQSYKIQEDPILVLNEHGQIKPLNELSFMISAISDKPEETVFLSIDSEIIEDPAIQTILHQLTSRVTA